MAGLDVQNLFRRGMLQLLSPKCYNEFFVKLNFFDVPCLKAALSKVLGLAIIAGSVMVKVPQIVKIQQNRSAAGVSFISVLLDLYAITSAVAYSYSRGFTFSAWGDTFFVLIQTIIIAALTLLYNNSGSAASAFVMCYLSVFYALIGGLTPAHYLWSMQASSIPIMVVGKLIQAFTNYKNGGTGQLSAVTCFLLFFGSTARIFTSIQETGDNIIILTYSLATLGNGLIVSQFIYYYLTGGKKTVAEKKKKR